MTTPSNELVLEVDGFAYSGWTAIRVSRSCEHIPNFFDIVVTEHDPKTEAVLAIKPGQSCRVLFGSDVVITGFNDRVSISIGPREHTVRIQGRGKCQDAVDRCAVISGMQVFGASVLGVAQQLCAPFNIEVTSLSGPGPAVPTFPVILTEHVFEIVERMCRYAGLLCYEDTFGNMVLSRVGTTSHSSGFSQGVNVEEASATFAVDQRYSIYIATTMTEDRLSDIGSSGNLLGIATDPFITRLRRLIIASEQSALGQPIALLRAQWEKARRFGRSQEIRLVADSYRDSSGKLWEPNALVPLSLPALKIDGVSWIISSVDFIRDGERGSVAELVLMPPEAFVVQPDPLQLIDWQVDKALHPAAATQDPTAGRG
jgi:prophage tail gpP-like protein